MTILEHTVLRPFHTNDLEPLVAFWNSAFADRRNFYPITAADFQSRVLNCAAFHPDGLILAWHERQGQQPQLIGLVHAFRPAPQHGLYAKGEQRHNLALLYVDPAHRRRGIGSRLLRAAENWLYYCPVYVGGTGQPCYGTVEGPQPPFFGSSQRLGISVHDRSLINFLAFKGYRVIDPGDVSMQLQLSQRGAPAMPDLAAWGLQLVSVSHEQPFCGREPQGREEYVLWGANGGAPYRGYLLVDGENMLQGHISCYPMRQAGRAAIAGFWVAPSLRGQGLGRYLLERTLYDLALPSPSGKGTIGAFTRYHTVEVQTHMVKHAQAVALYERTGFVVDTAWVNMVKECTVRWTKPVGLSAY